MTVRTRFAPSPTGYLHIGGVRTALFNWLFARQSGGQFILRIDDTDQQRNIATALQPILDGFQWLGIDWDEGPTLDGSDSTGPHAPYFQSERAQRHQDAAAILLEKGLAYKDYARPEETVAEREAAEKEKRDFLYSRTWMAETEAECQKFEAEGRKFVVRLKMPRDGKCEFNDLVCGDVAFDWSKEQDHVIQRNDGSCLYHLASVVDDHDMAITHVIRGIEHLSNTPRQIFIAQSLGFELPIYGHLPYVAAPGSKEKMSKRKITNYMKNRDFEKLYKLGIAVASRVGIEEDPNTFNPVLVDFYEQVGFLPDAIANYMLLVGWSLDGETEEFSREQMLEHFSMDRVVKAPASFDPLKLIAFQQRYMDRLPTKQKVPMCLRFLQKAGLVSDPVDCEIGPFLTKIVEAAGDRLTMAGDILQFDDFFVADDEFSYDEKAFQKRLVKAADAGHLVAEFKKLLITAPDFTAEPLQELLKGFCETFEIKIGQIIHALRVAVSGKAAGFGMFETLEILGRDRCIARIDRTLNVLAAEQV